MDHGTTPLAELQEKLVDLPAFAMAAVETGGDRPLLRTCQVIVGARPPGWAAREWVYPRLRLVASELSASRIAASLSAEREQELQLGSSAIPIPPVFDTVRWEHRPSRAAFDDNPLPWPTHEYIVDAPQSRTARGPRGFLVADNAPTFLDDDYAIRAFFFGDFTLTGTRRGVPSELLRLRLVDLEAWFHRVVITSTRLAVVVRGNEPSGARVEITSSTLRAHRRVGRSGSISVRMRDGLPDDAWLFLARGTRWLDHRPLGHGLGYERDLRSSGVEIIGPNDAEARVRVLLDSGEGPRVEYKSRLPGSTDAEKRKVLKTVAAFANGAGGAIVFGVDPDEHSLTGVTEDSRAGRDRLADVIRSWVVPNPEFEVESVSVDGMDLLVAHIAAGGERPYGIQPGPDRPIEFYVRRGASTYPARQYEIRSSVLATSAPAGMPGYIRQ